MPAYRKASIRSLILDAYRLDGHSLQGELHRDPEDGQWKIGDQSLERWLARHEGEELALILLSMDDDRPLEKKVCRTCGREYRGAYCPHCREVRLRLRGE
jgi:hypothetical protein